MIFRKVKFDNGKEMHIPSEESFERNNIKSNKKQKRSRGAKFAVDVGSELAHN